MQWLKTLPDPMDISLAEVNDDTSAYLLPDYEDDDEQDEILRRFYGHIFEEQLDGWWTDERDWPQNRTLELFAEWFTVEFHSLVIDLVDAPLESEE
ncbi:MAG: VacJ [Nitrospirota bacterium]|nr:VacJ [Nitrospirota bacterium]